MDGSAFRCLVALIIVAYLTHRIYYVRKVPHASDSVVKQPREPGAAINVLLMLTTVVVLALYVVAPRRVSSASFPLPGPIRRQTYRGVAAPTRSAGPGVTVRTTSASGPRLT